VAVTLLVLATAGVYAKLPSHDFAYYDDEHYVTANVHVRQGLSWASIRWAFTSVGHADNWHPLTWLSHLLDVQLFGLKPGGHHLMSLALHVAATLLLFGFLAHATRRPWPSALVAAGFALHPLHVESVAWVAERKDVLSACFGFATLWAYGRYARAPSVKRYLLVFLLFALGLLAKPMLVTLPVLLLLVDYWPLERLRADLPSIRQRCVEKLPLLALSLASSVVTVIAQRQALGSLEHYRPLSRLANAVIAYGVYLRQAVWPTGLSVVYAYPPPQLLRTLGAAALLIAITAAVGWLGRTHRYLITGWLWYLVSLLPVIGIVQVGSQPHADRYSYIPLVGVLIAVVWGAATVLAGASRRRRYLAYAAGAVLVVAMILRTREQVGYWKNGLALFTHAFAVAQGDLGLKDHYNYGNILLEAGRRDEAAYHFEQALRRDPHHAESHLSYGGILSDRGQTEQAIQHYVRALERNPKLAEAHSSLGAALARSGREAEAAAHFARALAIDPSFGDAHYNFAFLLSGQGRMDEAMFHYRRALELRPDDRGARWGLARCLARRGRLDEARAPYQKALALEPDNVDVLIQLGVLLDEAGKDDEAIAYYRRALGSQPTAIVPLHNLAMKLAQAGDRSAATAVVERALSAARATGDEAQVAAVREIVQKLEQTAPRPDGAAGAAPP
jgi:tetratricopeptide (TPR) repeat protein